MSDNRELLELAAKAAGVDLSDDHYWHKDDRVWVYWNPLTGDGDALRLAVKLEFDVCQQIQTNDPVTPAGCVVVAPGGHTCFEANGDDPYAATRRAIVRAAAEIGGTMP